MGGARSVGLENLWFSRVCVLVTLGGLVGCQPAAAAPEPVTATLTAGSGFIGNLDARTEWPLGETTLEVLASDDGSSGILRINDARIPVEQVADHAYTFTVPAGGALSALTGGRAAGPEPTVGGLGVAIVRDGRAMLLFEVTVPAALATSMVEAGGLTPPREAGAATAGLHVGGRRAALTEDVSTVMAAGFAESCTMAGSVCSECPNKTGLENAACWGQCFLSFGRLVAWMKDLAVDISNWDLKAKWAAFLDGLTPQYTYQGKVGCNPEKTQYGCYGQEMCYAEPDRSGAYSTAGDNRFFCGRAGDGDTQCERCRYQDKDKPDGWYTYYCCDEGGWFGGDQ